MFIRSREVPPNTEISVAVCVVGSGPAGLGLCLELDNFSGRVALVESGGFEPSADAQDLARAENVGLPFLAPDISRCRFFGGTSARWAGFCRPLDADDFMTREWLPNSGWPFAASELAPHYDRAAAICQVEDVEWNPQDWFQDVRATSALPPVGSAFFAANIFRSPNRYFGTSYRAHFERARTEVYTGATVVEIETDDRASRVERVCVEGPGGNRFWIRAKWFVLATGGIENARLLLTANRVQSAGLGNGNDLVGRYLMNHPQVAGAWFALKNPNPQLTTTSQRTIPAAQRITASPATMQREGIAKFSAYLLPAAQSQVHPWAKGAAFTALTSLMGINQKSALVPNRAALMGALLSDVPGLVGDLATRLIGRVQGRRILCVLAECEQVPNRESRVRLTAERDRFGLQKASIDWHLTALDKRTIRRGIVALQNHMEAAEVAETVYDPWVLNDDLSTFPGEDWAHHAGTTRMHDSPKQGVVDRHGRVHGVENLYVAGCSVFPTEGMAPPTLTIIALACRLGAHIKAQALQTPVAQRALQSTG